MMRVSQLSSLALWLSVAAPSLAEVAHTAGSFEDGGDTLVSAMMMFLGTEKTVFIMDKSEGNAATFDGFPAMGASYNIASRSSTTMGIKTNVFCASGMHVPNGSYVTFGGNGAIGPGGNIGDEVNSAGSGAYDTTYGDLDGTKAIRVLDPCDDNSCEWFDDPTVLAMDRSRWYSTAEPLGNGTIAILGGFVNGGYINRNYPNVDPEFEGGAAENTYEFYPSLGPAKAMPFLVNTSGLNSYPLAYLMPSGKMLIQANYSTILWDPDTGAETYLPDMPDQIVRVYPASGANAMLPLTPANNYTPTVLFCGGIYLEDDVWGNYSWPFADTWNIPSSKKCHKITPEPIDGSSPDYIEEDDLLETRTMGQFVALPDGTMLIVNGGNNGTAGYSTRTLNTTEDEKPLGLSLAAGPAGTPSIYNPNAPAGSRFSNEGFATSSIARLYHSSAILLPDASVMIAGSNPNVDVNLTTVFPTTYKAEIFYPAYFSATTRPVPTGMPTKLSYGGDAFNVSVPASSYSGSANDAAANTTVWLIRGGWTTHAMNMGQRSMQLNNTFTVGSDGSYVLHVSQLPPNPNLFQPGPALLFVTVSGIPSNGTLVTVGNGEFGTQPTSAAASLPPNVRVNTATGSAPSGTSGSGSASSTQSSGATSSTGGIIGGVLAAIAVVGLLGAGFGICLARRRRAAAMQASSSGAAYPMGTPFGGGASVGSRGLRDSDSSAFVPLQQGNPSAWDIGNTSTMNINAPYRDGRSGEFDPYYESAPRISTSAMQPRY